MPYLRDWRVRVEKLELFARDCLTGIDWLAKQEEQKLYVEGQETVALLSDVS